MLGLGSADRDPTRRAGQPAEQPPLGARVPQADRPGFAVSGQTRGICGLYQWLAEDGFRACVYAAAGVSATSVTARSCLGVDIPSFFVTAQVSATDRRLTR